MKNFEFPKVPVGTLRSMPKNYKSSSLYHVELSLISNNDFNANDPTYTNNVRKLVAHHNKIVHNDYKISKLTISNIITLQCNNKYYVFENYINFYGFINSHRPRDLKDHHYDYLQRVLDEARSCNLDWTLLARLDNHHDLLLCNDVLKYNEYNYIVGDLFNNVVSLGNQSTLLMLDYLSDNEYINIDSLLKSKKKNKKKVIMNEHV